MGTKLSFKKQSSFFTQAFIQLFVKYLIFVIFFALTEKNPTPYFPIYIFVISVKPHGSETIFLFIIYIYIYQKSNSFITSCTVCLEYNYRMKRRKKRKKK
jgi:hypothetical protein